MRTTPPKKEQVAIITRTLGIAPFLRRAARSVLEQTWENWQHVVVIDGGNKTLVEVILSEFSDAYAGRLKIVHLPERQGMQNASNRGIEASESEFVVIHDDDDSWKPSFLQECCEYLINEGSDSQCQGVATQITQVNEEFTYDGCLIERERLPYLPFTEISLSQMSERNQIAPIAFLYRRKAHETVGLYQQRYDVVGDHDFLLRFLLHYQIGTVRNPLANYHWRHSGMNNTVTGSLDRHRRMYIRLKDDYLRLEMQGKLQGLGKAIQQIQLPQVKDPMQERIIPSKFHLGEEPPPVPLNTLVEQAAENSKTIILYAEGLVYDWALRTMDDLDLIWERLGQAQHSWPEAPFAAAKSIVKRLQVKDAEANPEDIHAKVINILGLKEDLLSSLGDVERLLEERLFKINTAVLATLESLAASGKSILLYEPHSHTLSLLQDRLKAHALSSLKIANHCRDLKPNAEQSSNHEVPFLVASRHSAQARRWLHKQQCEQTLTLLAEEPSAWVDKRHFRDVYADGDTFSSVTTGLAREYAQSNTPEYTDENFWAKLGYELVGPMMIAFLIWLRDRLRSEPARRIFFIARDGVYLQKLWEKLAKADTTLPDARLLWCSRRLFLCGRMQELNGETIQALIDPNPNMRVRDFLTRLHLVPEDYSKELALHGFNDLDQYLTQPHGGSFLSPSIQKKLSDFFQEIWPKLDQLFSKEREHLRAYLEQIGYDPQQDVLVDLGWNGSSMHALWSMEPTKYIGMRTFYFASWRKAEVYANQGIRFESFFMHFMQPYSRAFLVRESVNILETLFAGPVSSAIALKRAKSGKINPVHGQVTEGTITGEPADIVWKNVDRFAKDITSHTAWPILQGGEAYIEMVLSRLVQQPTPREARLLGAIKHSEGFGSSYCIPMAKPEVEPEVLDDALLIPYRQAGWKSGFLALVSPIQRKHIINVENSRLNWGIDDYRSALMWQANVTTDYWRKAEESRRQVNELRQTNAKLRETHISRESWQENFEESLLEKFKQQIDAALNASADSTQQLLEKIPYEMFEPLISTHTENLHNRLKQQLDELSRYHHDVFSKGMEQIEVKLGGIEQNEKTLKALHELQRETDKHITKLPSSTDLDTMQNSLQAAFDGEKKQLLEQLDRVESKLTESEDLIERWEASLLSFRGAIRLWREIRAQKKAAAMPSSDDSCSE